MTKMRLLMTIALLGLVAAIPAVADNSQGAAIGDLGKQSRQQAADQLQACAAEHGVELEGEPILQTQGESTLAFQPVRGIGYFTRAHFVNWTTVGVFVAQGPADAELPSGGFRVQVRAKPGATTGDVQIVGGDGQVVHESEMAIEDDPNGTMPENGGSFEGIELPLAGKAGPDGAAFEEGKYFPYYGFRCPWFWPYFGPYYYRPFLGYKHGCYRWNLRWWWGHIGWRYCWWPSRFCVNCRHHW